MSLPRFVAVTGISVKDRKYVILKRSEKEKFWQGKLIVQGVKLDKTDHAIKKETNDAS